MVLNLRLIFLIINKKWKNSAKNCRAFNSFISVASDHRIISAKICLCLRANKKKLCQHKPFNWSTLKDDSDVRKSFITEVKNGYTVLQETEQNESTANSRNNNFEKACKEAATKEIPLKPKMINNYHGKHRIYIKSVKYSIKRQRSKTAIQLQKISKSLQMLKMCSPKCMKMNKPNMLLARLMK